MIWGNVLISLFYMWLSSFLVITCWRDCFSFTAYSCLPHHRLICHRYVGLFLDSLFSYIYLLIYIHSPPPQYHTILSIALQYCLTSWRVIPPALFFYLMIPFQFWSLVVPYKFWTFFFLSLLKYPEYFDRDCIKSVDFFE